MTHLYRRTLTNDSFVPTAMNSPSGESSAQVTAEKGVVDIYLFTKQEYYVFLPTANKDADVHGSH